LVARKPARAANWRPAAAALGFRRRNSFARGVSLWAAGAKIPGTMMTARSENLIVWGDCDSAGIVYYPRYFYFMDIAFQVLMRQAGFSHRILFEQFGARIPIVDVGAKFIAPTTFDDPGSSSTRRSYTGGGRVFG
jgi:hypothetical protein